MSAGASSTKSVDDNTKSKVTTSRHKDNDNASQEKDDPICPVYHCWICSAEFGDKLGIVKHLKEKHKDRPKLRGIERRMKNPICLVCGSPAPCERHKKEKHKVAKQEVESSEEGEENGDDDEPSDEDNNTTSVVHPDVLYCVTCEAPFTNPDDLHNHRFSEHPGEKSYQCSYCSGTYAEQSHLTLHTRVHTGRRPYICEICGSDFLSDSDLQIHILSHSGVTVKPFQCAQCNQSFTHKSSLEKHARSHARQSGGHPCLMCGLVFQAMEELVEHASTVHKSAHWQCKTCGKLYKEERHLLLHEKGHHTLRPYGCTYCDRTFVTQALQHKHEDKVHHSKPQIKCDECGKQFKRRENLTRHKQSHRGIKNFRCEVCGQSFTEKGSLTRHTRSQHDQLKPHTCSLCPRAFTRRILLQKHMERYHDNKSEGS